MAKKSDFTITPMAIPNRIRDSKYSDFVKFFIDSGEESGEIGLNGTKLETAYQGFHKIIQNRYAGHVELERVNGRLFIKRIKPEETLKQSKSS